MRHLFSNLSLSRRYSLFLFVVITVLFAGSLMLTSSVVRGGMLELYKQRLRRCNVAFNQYADLHFVRKASEIEAVVTSPRFIAAVETGDYQTIVNEVPYYKQLLGATVFIVEDAGGNILYGQSTQNSITDSASLFPLLTIRSQDRTDARIRPYYIRSGNELIELYGAQIITSDGLYVGRLLAGDRVSGFMVKDLERLTGFDILLIHNNVVVAHSSSALVDQIRSSPELYLKTSIEVSKITQLSLEDNEAFQITEFDDRLNIAAMFLGVPDKQISPVLSQMRTFLIVLAIVGGLLAMLTVHEFTSRHIGRQINMLVQATESISKGELDFELSMKSNDEFGALAGAVDTMRVHLSENRDEIIKLHQNQIDSERLAAVGKSATGIIHDFRSPMTVIRGTAELISIRHKDDEQLAQHLENITKQIDRMGELAQDVIEFSRGKFNLSITPICLGEYIADIRAAHIDAYNRAGIELTIIPSDDCVLKIDPLRFRRVIDNILHNAREALKPGQRVDIEWLFPNGELNLTISDNGPGIIQEIRETLFEPFVTSGKESGTGLGLAIAMKIVEDHNATLQVESDSNQGTSFRVIIPESMVSRNTKHITAV